MLLLLLNKTAASAQLAATIAPFTASATGTVDVAATCTATIGPFTASATGQVLVQGSDSEAIGNFTLAGTGIVEVHATLAQTLGAFTLSAAGTVEVHATCTATIAPFTAAGAGAVEVHAADSEEAIGAFTLSASGILEVHAAAAATLGPFTASAAGGVEVHAALAATIGPFTLSSTSSGVEATPDLTAKAHAAQVAFGGPGVSRTRTRPRELSIYLPIPAPWLSAVGEASAPPAGEFAARLDLDFVIRAAGAVGVAGRALGYLPPLTCAAAGWVAPVGDAAATIQPFVIRAHGRHDHFTDADLTQLAAVLEEFEEAA
jgi:hypothetical protein